MDVFAYYCYMHITYLYTHVADNQVNQAMLRTPPLHNHCLKKNDHRNRHKKPPSHGLMNMSRGTDPSNHH